MSTEIALPKGFGAVSNVFAGTTVNNDELGQGVASSYGVIGYKGKVWSTRFQGVDTPLMREDGDGPRNSIEVVLVKASPAVSKIFYKGGYVEGSTAAPDCWSADGVKPDGSVQAKVHASCADCPMNAWGSRITEAGKQGKACADSRRVAIVPLEDMDNDLFGGPMLLRIPAASLKDLKAYGDLLNSYQYPYYAVATRIAFDPKEAFPKFVFSAIRPLTDDEARKVMTLREDKRVGTVLSESTEMRTAVAQEPAKEVAKSPFEQDTKPLSEQAKATGPRKEEKPAEDTAAIEAKKAAIAEKKRKAAEAAAEAARLAALAAAEAEAEEDEVTDEGTSDSAASSSVESFDDMLDSLMND